MRALSPSSSSVAAVALTAFLVMAPFATCTTAPTALAADVHPLQCPSCAGHHHHHQGGQHGRSGGGGGGGGGGSGDESADRQFAEAIRLEAIKQQILTKLGLKHRPNVTSTLPRDVVIETLHRAGAGAAAADVAGTTRGSEDGGMASATSSMSYDEEDDYYGRTSEIIAFAQPGYTFNGQRLLKFTRSQGDDADIQVKSALLWVKADYTYSINRHLRSMGLLPDRKITIYVFRVKPLSIYNTTHLSSKLVNLELLASSPLSLKSLGWQKFDVTDAVQQWYAHHPHNTEQDKLQLLVDCSGCGSVVSAVTFSTRDLDSSATSSSSSSSISSLSSSSSSSGDADFSHPHHHQQRSSEKEPVRAKHQPFLVLQTAPLVPRRVRRRALECGPHVKQCCKQRFYVSFKQLGWDDWIIAPRGYYANYCRGDCGGIHRTPDTFLNYYTHVIEEYRKMDWQGRMQPCCAPTKFSSMSLIYYGPDLNIIKRDLPKMVVDECGCP